MIYSFLQTIRDSTLSLELVHQAKRCLLDTLGVAAAGSQTPLANKMKTFVSQHYLGKHNVPLLFSDDVASPVGAAMYGAAIIDSIDAHDGHVLVKGHVGVSIVPSLLALTEALELSGEDFLKAIVIGYEVATRAGIALHQTACDYHTSGAWNGLGVVALGAFLHRLSEEELEHALGIAEFYGPRSQMMRLIDHPSMLKDGSSFGALTGMTALYLAKDGFTGAPALTIMQDEVKALWTDLGSRWRLFEQYFKAYPVCRWSQPAIESVLSLKREHKFTDDDVEAIEVFSFHEAIRLASSNVQTTEEAQYSLPYPVAAALLDDDVTAEAILLQGKHEERVALANKVKLIEHEPYNQKFPAERWAHSSITLKDGRKVCSKPKEARGDAHAPLSNEDISHKFFNLSSVSLDKSKAKAIHEAVMTLETRDVSTLFELLS